MKEEEEDGRKSEVDGLHGGDRGLCTALTCQRR
jgi:hypothetical protein